MSYINYTGPVEASVKAGGSIAKDSVSGETDSRVLHGNITNLDTGIDCHFGINSSDVQNGLNDVWHYTDYDYFDSEYDINMEVDRDYIVDYDEYRKVLEECNHTLHTTPYPNDGKLSKELIIMKMVFFMYI